MSLIFKQLRYNCDLFSNSILQCSKVVYICPIKIKQTMKNSKKQTVQILGQTVTVGTKLHAKLVAQVKHFNDLSKYETN